MSTIEDTDARIEYERDHRAPTDLELEPITSEDEDYESAPPDYQISTYPADFTLEVLHQKWKAGDILIPDFQRGFVWKQVQASKLLESFLVGLPVPAVFLYSERKSQKFFVIDGQQRLKSIFYFFEGYFGPETQGARRVFRLTGLSPDSVFKDKLYEDLRDEDKRRLKNAVLRAFIVLQLDPADDTSMYHVFERLNTGGTLLTNQEIRHCIYHGNFISFLNQANTLPAWRRILGKDVPDTHRKDIELLVRFFAMRDISAYRKPMKDFLSKFMKKNRDASAEVLGTSRRIFERTCDNVVASLGEKPFHVRAGLNAAVFDAVTTAFSNHLDEVPDDIQDRYARLKLDKTFEDNTRNGTTDVDTVKQRLKQAETMLFG
ncbi:MAG: DUF262 domain-containing protein [Pseudomonadota bacterium]|nr:DUF262 domain-containing protein [Pseudomonadota bacterium]